MVEPNKQTEKLFRRFVKDKKLQKLGNSLVLIIPKTWIKALNWDQETALTMALHPEDRKIIISEKKVSGEVDVAVIEEEKDGEETGEPILV